MVTAWPAVQSITMKPIAAVTASGQADRFVLIDSGANLRSCSALIHDAVSEGLALIERR